MEKFEDLYLDVREKKKRYTIIERALVNILMYFCSEIQRDVKKYTYEKATTEDGHEALTITNGKDDFLLKITFRSYYLPKDPLLHVSLLFTSKDYVFLDEPEKMVFDVCYEKDGALDFSLSKFKEFFEKCRKLI